MVSIRTLSRPYAKAAYEVAKQEKKLDHWMQFFHFISKLIKVNRVQQIVKNETITADKVISFFSSFCKKTRHKQKTAEFS
jgi:F0F1-type ATP synthase delta subunit